jgi:hypothetical protein
LVEVFEIVDVDFVWTDSDYWTWKFSLLNKFVMILVVSRYHIFDADRAFETSVVHDVLNPTRIHMLVRWHISLAQGLERGDGKTISV